MCVLQHVLELTDASFNLALFFTSGVISTVLFQIALGASRFNLLDDIGATRTLKVSQLRCKAVGGFLSKPGLGHVISHKVEKFSELSTSVKNQLRNGRCSR